MSECSLGEQLSLNEVKACTLPTFLFNKSLRVAFLCASLMGFCSCVRLRVVEGRRINDALAYGDLSLLLTDHGVL